MLVYPKPPATPCRTRSQEGRTSAGIGPPVKTPCCRQARQPVAEKTSGLDSGLAFYFYMMLATFTPVWRAEELSSSARSERRRFDFTPYPVDWIHPNEQKKRKRPIFLDNFTRYTDWPCNHNYGFYWSICCN